MIPRNNHFTVGAYTVVSLLLQWVSTFLQVWRVWGLSRKYPAILNILRTGRMAWLLLGSQWEDTLLCIREQSLSCGASQSAVRRRWLSLCTVWPHSQWPNEQISFIMTMCLPILQLSCGLFWQSITSPRSVSPPAAQIWLCDFWLFPKLKSPLRGRRFVNATVMQYTTSVVVVSLPTDQPHWWVTVHRCAVRSLLSGCQVTSRPRERFSRYSKWLDTFKTALVTALLRLSGNKKKWHSYENIFWL